jgi:hypothetical protein
MTGTARSYSQSDGQLSRDERAHCGHLLPARLNGSSDGPVLLLQTDLYLMRPFERVLEA